MDLVFSRTKEIPTTLFGRECSLCSSRHGVPIECSARGCKAAYHTTCAIRGKLKMQAIFGTSFKGGIKLRSYCHQHSPTMDLNNGLSRHEVNEIDMTNLADDGIQETNEELDYFWKYVDINRVQKTISEMYSKHLTVNIKTDDDSQYDCTPKKRRNISQSHSKTDTISAKYSSPKKAKTDHRDKYNIISSSPVDDPLVVDLIYRYWMLLRTAYNGQSLIKFSPSALREREFEQRKRIMKLRIELERVRNLSYMICKREKLKANWLKTHANILKRTFNIINDLKPISEDKPNASSCPTQNGHLDQAHYTHTSPGKKSLHPPQLPLNGMFDETDQLINDLISCDMVYEIADTSANSNSSKLSYQDRCTSERRRTLSLVRRINRQLKTYSADLSPSKKG